MANEHAGFGAWAWTGGMIVTTPPQLHCKPNGSLASNAALATNV